jgi:CheY-like chemotaxis protein
MPEQSSRQPHVERRHSTRRVRDVFAAFSGDEQAHVRRDLDRRLVARRGSDPPVSDTPPPEAPPAGPATDPSWPTVLVVDDIQATRAGLTELLRLRRYNALQASDGADAIRTLRSHVHVVRAIILDLQMPEYNGYWFREQQLKDPALAAIPVIVFTGSSVSPSDVTRELQGATVLLKPFSVDQLFTLVERHCGPSQP